MLKCIYVYDWSEDDDSIDINKRKYINHHIIYKNIICKKEKLWQSDEMCTTWWDYYLHGFICMVGVIRCKYKIVVLSIQNTIMNGSLFSLVKMGFDKIKVIK